MISAKQFERFMGGVNSGTWFRYGTKKTIDSCKRIDVRYMQRQNLLRPGYQGSLNWTCNGEPNGNITYQFFQNLLVLKYRYKQNSETEWKDAEQRIKLTETACNYGGVRKWFLCPSCDKRVAILCDAHATFTCRHCSNVTYRIQKENHHGRMVARRNKAYSKIHDKHGRLKSKPKGMHYTTWSKYWSDYIEADHETDLALIALFRKQHFLTEEE